MATEEMTNMSVHHLVEGAFTKIRELGEGKEASWLFPNGITSLVLDVESTRDDATQRIQLKLEVAPLPNGNGTMAGADADDEILAGVSFNAEGHHVIAMIAMADLQTRFPGTATRVQALLDSGSRSLLDAAVFPDTIRTTHPETKPFHFVDIPLRADGPLSPALPAPPHVITKIAEFAAFLQSGGGTVLQRVDALSWLLHLFGDIHQPLHCVERFTADHPGGDRGGNSFKVKGSARNLHALWDSSVDFTNTDEEELVPGIMNEHSRASLSPDLTVTDVEAWARASFLLAKSEAYSLKENTANPPKPSAKYLANANKVGRRQAALAGYRLADRLHAIFG
jgi:S1/P1 Nuclease